MYLYIKIKLTNYKYLYSIVTMLRKFEQLCQYYAIPILFLDSHK